MFDSINCLKKAGLTGAFILIFVVLGSTLVAANMHQIKLYKTAFPGTAPKCTICHIGKMPKKEEGKHELNAYGKKIREAQEITAETYTQVGTYEEFEAQQNHAQEGEK